MILLVIKVLLASPYDPTRRHDHAAQDILAPLCEYLGRSVELHVYCPAETVATSVPHSDLPYTLHIGSPPPPRTRQSRFSKQPFRLQNRWTTKNSIELVSLASRLRPNIVHAEYFHPCTALIGLDGPALTGTMHDISSRIVADQLSSASRRRKPVALFDLVQTRRLESRYIRNLEHCFVFSENDLAFVEKHGASASVVRLGLNPVHKRWQPSSPPTLVFAGALWRQANEQAATFLVHEVMPKVWGRHPEVSLRLVGARPTALVRRLAEESRVEVVGDVPELDTEYARARLSLAPSMVEAGVLLKALRSMALGVPVVLNLHSARGIHRLIPDVHAAVGKDASGFADAVVRLLDNPELADALGRNGEELVHKYYSWEALVEDYLSGFDRALQLRS